MKKPKNYGIPTIDSGFSPLWPKGSRTGYLCHKLFRPVVGAAREPIRLLVPHPTGALLNLWFLGAAPTGCAPESMVSWCRTHWVRSPTGALHPHPSSGVHPDIPDTNDMNSIAILPVSPPIFALQGYHGNN